MSCSVIDGLLGQLAVKLAPEGGVNVIVENPAGVV